MHADVSLVQPIDETVRPDEEGRSRDVPDRNIRIEIAAVSGDIASAIVRTAVYVEFLLLARTSQGWQITGVLWRWAEGHGPRA